MNNNSNSNSNSNQNNSVKPNNLRNIAQKQARRRIVGALIFLVLVVIFLPFLLDNSRNQKLDEVAVNIPQQNTDGTTQSNNNNNPANENDVTVSSADAEDDNAEINIPDVATSLNNNSTPEEENKTVTAKIIQKQDSEKQKLTSQNQQKIIAEDKENKAKAEKARLAKLEKEKAERAEREKLKAKKEKEEKEKEKNKKNDDSKRAAAILAGFDEPTKKVEKSEKSENKSQKYIISIGAFSDENNVKNLRKKLSDLKIASYTEAIDSGKKIRVRAGPFTSEKDAQSALNKMQSAGISGKISASK